MPDDNPLKMAVGVKAAELVDSGMRLGLGTGSTVAHLLVALAERINGGALVDLGSTRVAISVSMSRSCLAMKCLRIPFMTLA